MQFKYEFKFVISYKQPNIIELVMVGEWMQQSYFYSLYKAEMESKYRKLYLYASNTQAIAKQPSDNYDEYKLKKEKSIEHLQQLLDIKIGLPSITSFLIFDKSDGQVDGDQRARSREHKRLKILRSKPKTSTLTQKQTFLPSTSRLLQIDPNQFCKMKEAKQAKKRLSQQEKEKVYEKYINQYMEKLQKQNALEKYSERDYSALVQQACRQIRKKMGEDHLQIQEVQKELQYSRDSRLIPLKQKKKKKAKNQQKREESMEQLGIHHQSFMSSMGLKLLLRRDQHKKSKSVAQNNLYRLNLELVQKKNALKNKVRKRSQKQFVRHLTRHHSVLQTLPPPLS